MSIRVGLSRWQIVFMMAMICGVAAVTWPAEASGPSGFSGVATYTGELGPVSSQRTICVCVYSDPGLTEIVYCLEVDSSPGSYTTDPLDMKAYYVLAFVDFNLNVALDPGEPYEIYNGKGTLPGDPIVAASPFTTADVTFGDENIAPIPPASPTPTSSATLTSTPTPTPTSTSPPATVTPTALACVGDCNGDGHVTVDEILTLVNVALNATPLADCPAGDANDDQEITIDEILRAVHNAVSGCTPGSPA